MKRLSLLALFAAALVLVSGCVTSTVDEMVFDGPQQELGEASIVILGRRHGSDYETEPDFIECVSDHIRSGDKSLIVLSELEFQNELYPWFEPRTAPMRPGDITRLLEIDPVRERMAILKTEYMVWIDGSTTRTEGSGSMTCGIGPGAAGCFGFGTWGNDAAYEAVIWDFTDQQEVGRMNTTASGQSYMPAIVIPIPIIAPVQGTACDGLGQQLLQFFSSKY
jgi:hypothetical protein